MSTEPLRHLDLFSGIGGFAIATEMVWDTVEHVFCDNDPFSQAILKKHWPNAPIYGDIRKLTADPESGYLKSEGQVQAGRASLVSGNIDLITGGFPCQPFSAAGRRKGTADDRHLWPEMLRVIHEFHPRWVVGENVGGFVTWDEGMVLEQVHFELESEGYEVQSFIIPAVSLNAPHRRDRVWIVAHAKSGGERREPADIRGEERGQELNEVRDRRSSDNVRTCPYSDSRGHEGVPEWSGEGTRSGSERRTTDASNAERERSGEGEGQNPRVGTKPAYPINGGTGWDEDWPSVAARLCRVDDGVPRRMDRTLRLKGLGNAIVPQVAAEIMKAIKYAK